MAQSDQIVANATFPSVRADINDNLAALFTQSSGFSAPSITIAFQPWVDISSSPPVWKVRNSSNSAWITVGVLDPAGFQVGGIAPIANGGTGATTAITALAALLPSQTGNAGKALITSGSLASWGTVAAGTSIQTFTASATYTPTSGKTTFLVFATGGGGGGGSGYSGASGGGGGGGGTAFRLYSTTEMGASAAVTIGAGGSGAGGNTSFDPAGTGLTITGNGGGGASGESPGGGGGSTNSLIGLSGLGGVPGSADYGTPYEAPNPGGGTFFAGRGAGGNGSYGSSGSAGSDGMVMVLEF